MADYRCVVYSLKDTGRIVYRTILPAISSHKAREAIASEYAYRHGISNYYDVLPYVSVEKIRFRWFE